MTRPFLLFGLVAFAQLLAPMLQADEYNEIGQPVTSVYTPKELSDKPNSL